MDSADVPPPPTGADAEEGVRHYVEYIARGSQRQEAANLLKGWLTDQILTSAHPGDYGALYCVWADLEDVADAFDDEATFQETARIAADEWLAAAANRDEREAWVGRWNDWLRHYGAGHTVVWERPGELGRRYAELVRWARQAMDGPFTPFAAAQKVMEFVDNEPAFADAPGVEDLWQAILAFEVAGPADRGEAEALIRSRLQSLPTSPMAE